MARIIGDLFMAWYWLILILWGLGIIAPILILLGAIVDGKEKNK